MLENTAIICNTYLDAINKVIKRPMVKIEGAFSANEFKKEITPLFKQHTRAEGDTEKHIDMSVFARKKKK